MGKLSKLKKIVAKVAGLDDKAATAIVDDVFPPQTLSWHKQLKAKKRAATPEEEKEINNIRNRIRRGSLPRLISSLHQKRKGKPRRIEFLK